jgi:hypothetical protein
MPLRCENCLKTNRMPGEALNATHLEQTLKRCNRCQRVFYCTAECQKSNWANHKLVSLPRLSGLGLVCKDPLLPCGCQCASLLRPRSQPSSQIWERAWGEPGTRLS